jgi:flagellin-specific chaperone FliS
MFDSLLESSRKAWESSLQTQQDVLKQMTQQWTTLTPKAGASVEYARTLQRRWLEMVFESLNKHRQSLDSLYQAGLDLLEHSIRLSDARSLEDCRRVTDELWRKVFEVSKVQSETQLHEAQKWAQKSLEIFQNGKP